MDLGKFPKILSNNGIQRQLLSLISDKLIRESVFKITKCIKQFLYNLKSDIYKHAWSSLYLMSKSQQLWDLGILFIFLKTQFLIYKMGITIVLTS